jgi:mannose-6-phosphate isomerase
MILRDDRSPSARSSLGGVRTDLAKLRDRLTEWLVDKAFPLWWEVGADRQRGGYHERIGLDGIPILEPRRARVQPRQIYCFSVAHDLDWPDADSMQIHHGLDYFERVFASPQGHFIALVDAKDRSLDGAFDLYNQAFALLGYAAADRILKEGALADRARRLLDLLESRYRRPDGGFYAGPDRSAPLLANPHMHLLEAALACEDQAGKRWHRLADEIATLALHRFIVAPAGALVEASHDDYPRLADGPAAMIEPGHQFEWAWLLERWGERRGDSRAREAARTLFDIGEKAGVDSTRDAAVAALNLDLTVRDPLARLWPQTERLKAALLLGAATGARADAEYYRAAALSAGRCIESFLNVALPGLWRDKLRADATFVAEPAPASSFYHIVGAVVELNRLIDA